MHSAQHAGNELVDTVTLLYETHQRGYPALIIASTLKVGEDEFLEGIDLVLEGHQIGNRLVTFIGVIDGLQANVLFVFESSCSRLAGRFCDRSRPSYH